MREQRKFLTRLCFVLVVVFSTQSHAWVATALAVGSAIAGAFGSIASGKASRASAQARAAEFKALLNKVDAIANDVSIVIDQLEDINQKIDELPEDVIYEGKRVLASDAITGVALYSGRLSREEAFINPQYVQTNLDLLKGVNLKIDAVQNYFSRKALSGDVLSITLMGLIQEAQSSMYHAYALTNIDDLKSKRLLEAYHVVSDESCIDVSNSLKEWIGGDIKGCDDLYKKFELQQGRFYYDDLGLYLDSQLEVWKRVSMYLENKLITQTYQINREEFALPRTTGNNPNEYVNRGDYSLLYPVEGWLYPRDMKINDLAFFVNKAVHGGIINSVEYVTSENVCLIYVEYGYRVIGHYGPINPWGGSSIVNSFDILRVTALSGEADINHEYITGGGYKRSISQQSFLVNKKREYMLGGNIIEYLPWLNLNDKKGDANMLQDLAHQCPTSSIPFFKSKMLISDSEFYKYEELGELPDQYHELEDKLGSSIELAEIDFSHSIKINEKFVDAIVSGFSEINDESGVEYTQLLLMNTALNTSNQMHSKTLEDLRRIENLRE